MKLYKQILEAINRGILLALDDFDDSREDIIKPAKETIRRGNSMKAGANFLALIDKLHSRTLDKHDTVYLPIWSKLAKEKYKVKDKKELQLIIHYIVGRYITSNQYIEGVDNFADLNWLDISNIDDLSEIFKFSKFYGDISKWDVSHVTDMHKMFIGSTFTRDISNWDVSNVENMQMMFAYSKFNSDISNWDVSNVKDMEQMFWADTEFDLDLSNWDVSNVIDPRLIFSGSAHMKMKEEFKPRFK